MDLHVLLEECLALLASGSDPTCHAGCGKDIQKPSDHVKGTLCQGYLSLVFVVGSVVSTYIRAYSIIQLHSDYKMKLLTLRTIERNQTAEDIKARH